MTSKFIPFIHNNEELKTFCSTNPEAVLANKIPFNWNFGLYGACLACNVELIDYMISLGANDFQWALRAISEKGSKELVIKIEKLCGDNINYNWALTGACKGNNVDIIKYYLEKDPKSIDSALRLACENNCEDAVMLLLKNILVLILH